MTDTHRFVGIAPRDLANGRVVAPGELISLTKKQADENEALIEEGQLVHLENKKATGNKEGGDNS